MRFAAITIVVATVAGIVAASPAAAPAEQCGTSGSFCTPEEFGFCCSGFCEFVDAGLSVSLGER